jgi:hypothetical protein
MKCYAILGLILDIFGVLLLAYFGFPLSFLEKKIVQWGYDKKDRIIQLVFSHIGVSLVISGFVFQIISYL